MVRYLTGNDWKIRQIAKKNFQKSEEKKKMLEVKCKKVWLLGGKEN